MANRDLLRVCQISMPVTEFHAPHPVPGARRIAAAVRKVVVLTDLLRERHSELVPAQLSSNLQELQDWSSGPPEVLPGEVPLCDWKLELVARQIER